MKKSGLWIPIALTVAAIYLISEYGRVPYILPWLSTEAKEMLGHLILYSGLGFLTTRYLWGIGLSLVAALPIALSLCGLLGIYDEFHQYCVGGRSVELFDVAMDVAGGFAGALAYASWALTRNLVLKAPAPEFRADILLRHGIVALTLFAFILIPATVYWVPITRYVEDRSAECSAFAEEVVRIWAPQALSKQARERSGANLSSEDEQKASNDALLQFIQVANMLNQKGGEIVASPDVGRVSPRLRTDGTR